MDNPLVKIRSMKLLFDDKEMSVDFDSETPLSIKERAEFKIQLEFTVEERIVLGIRYYHEIKRQGMTADKKSHMVGTYGPRDEPHIYVSPVDEFPMGLMLRGNSNYEVYSKLIDDDKNIHKAWTWSFDVCKDWE